MNVTFHPSGRRVCFWCIESAYLDKRTAVYRDIPYPTKQVGVLEDYRIYRHTTISRVKRKLSLKTEVEIPLHCKFFTEEPCKNLERCAEQRQVGAHCPIKNAIGVHNCGYKGSASEIEEHRMNRDRIQDLERLGYIGESNIIVADCDVMVSRLY